MSLPRIRFPLRPLTVAVAVVALAPLVGHSHGQVPSPLKAQLAAAQERHQRAVELNRAIELLARDHVRRPGMGQYSMHLMGVYYAPAGESLTRAVLEKHPDRAERATACHALALLLWFKTINGQQLREHPDWVKSYADDHGAEAIARFLRETDPDAARKESEAVLERVVNEFGDLPVPHSRRNLGEVAAGELNAIRNLNVGQTAPDIEGADVEGKPLKLTDFRGKVVLLVFSGEWYPDCVEMYARQRALLARYAGQPFAVVDINTDGTPDKLRASIKAGRVTWRCWVDAGIDGPIATRWGVKGYPGVYVLDARGVIRRKNVQGEGMDAAVDELMVEARE